MSDSPVTTEENQQPVSSPGSATESESISSSDSSEVELNQAEQITSQEDNPDMPSAAEQLNTIKPLMDNANFEVGQDAYLMPQDFVEKWFEATDTLDENSDRKLPKGPINTTLYYNKETRTPIYPSKCTEVTKEIWEYFKKWYGGEDAPLDVEFDSQKNKAMPVTEKIKTPIHYGDQVKDLYVPNWLSVKDYFDKCLKLFDIKLSEKAETVEQTEQPEKEEKKEETNGVENAEEQKTAEEPTKSPSADELDDLNDDKQDEKAEIVDNPTLEDFRLKDYHNSYLRDTLEMDKILKDHNIIDNNDVVLDYKMKNGKWYSETLQNTSYSYTDTTYTGNTGYSGGIYTGYNNYYGNTGYNYGYSRSTAYNNYYGGYYQSYGTPLGPGKVGFQNLGNTCFFNSGIQCLMHSKPLVQKLLSDDWEQDINEVNPLGTKGKLVRAFQKTLKEVWDGQSRVVAPMELKHVIGEFATRFAGWGQQDSHELITFMLDGIHEDLNRCRNKPQIETVTGDGTNDEQTAKIAWENHMKRNDSIIHDIFYGQLRSCCKCPNCGKTTVVFDPYSNLSLPISNPKISQFVVTFVPFNFAEKYVTLNLTLPIEPKPKDYDSAISREIGREVHVNIATIVSKMFKWGIQDGGYLSPTYLAFEIPDPDKFYVPCVVKFNLKDPYYTYAIPSLKEVSEIFLVEVDKSLVFERFTYTTPDEVKKEATTKAYEQIEKNVEEALSSVWNKDYPESEEGKAVKEQIEPYEENLLKEGQKITAQIKPVSAYYTECIEKSNDYPNVAQTTVSIYISEGARNEESGFSYSALVKHKAELKEATNDDSDSNGGSVTLEKCFEYFVTEETLDEDNTWRCPNCCEFVCATKKMDLWTAPQCLVVHLKRFSSGEYISHKDERLVEYPDELDIGRFIVGPKTTSTKYQLYGVSEHMGSTAGGHYTAHAVVSPLDKHTGQWYSFNDSSVSESTTSSAHNGSAYVLFYQRMDDDCPEITSSSSSSEDAVASAQKFSSSSSSSSDDNLMVAATLTNNQPMRQTHVLKAEDEEDSYEETDEESNQKTQLISKPIFSSDDDKEEEAPIRRKTVKEIDTSSSSPDEEDDSVKPDFDNQ